MPMTSDQLAQARMFLSDPGTSAVQSILLAGATGGTWTITFDGQTTSALAWNAQGGDVQNALCALSNVGVGNMLVVANLGVPGSIQYVLSFVAALGNVAQPIVTVNTSGLTGSGISATIVQLAAGGVVAFTDAELNGLFDSQELANGDLKWTIAYGFDILTSDATKFNAYTAGQTKEEKDQIYEHLKERAEWWHNWANSSHQVQPVGLQSVPPQVRAFPYQPGNPALGLSYRPWGSRRGRVW